MNFLKAFGAALLFTTISWCAWALTPWPIRVESAVFASAWLGWWAFFNRRTDLAAGGNDV